MINISTKTKKILALCAGLIITFYVIDIVSGFIIPDEKINFGDSYWISFQAVGLFFLIVVWFLFSLSIGSIIRSNKVSLLLASFLIIDTIWSMSLYVTLFRQFGVIGLFHSAPMWKFGSLTNRYLFVFFDVAYRLVRLTMIAGYLLGRKLVRNKEVIIDLPVRYRVLGVLLIFVFTFAIIRGSYAV